MSSQSNNTATATCFCGGVQLRFPLSKPGLVGTFVCHCTDCRKITASTFATNFTVDDAYLEHLRGREQMRAFGQKKTIASGNMMTNHFCGECGTLMYRVSEGFPGKSILRVGTVDDFALHETALKPEVEIFTDTRMGWLKPLEGVKQSKGMEGLTS